MTGEKWELKQPIRTYCPEVDTPIWEYIEGTHPSTRLTSAFWAGGIDEETMQTLPVPHLHAKNATENSSPESLKKDTPDGNYVTHSFRSQAI